METTAIPGDARLSPRLTPGPGRAQPTILVLDPDWDSRHILQALLGASGYPILEADSVSAALEYARQQSLAMIIADTRDRLGRSGVLAALRSEPRLATLPIIVYASWLFPVDEADAAQYGAAAFIPKPADHRVLLDEIERIVHPVGGIGSSATAGSTLN